jgi:hypothetical protein
VLTPKGDSAGCWAGLGWGVFFGVQMLVLPELAPAGGARWLVINLAGPGLDLVTAAALVDRLGDGPGADDEAGLEPAMKPVWSRR